MGDMLWSINTKEKQLFLTFDDGPTPRITQWVLKVLADYDAKSTFFCLGKNVKQFPEIYQQVIRAGHAVGNHTYNHPNGWKTKDEVYLDNVVKCSELVDSKLFRPPYGKISLSQNKVLKEEFTVVMWDVLAGDFDLSITPEKCCDNVISNASEGSIIVMHDSIKAEKNLKYALPKVLEYFTEEGYRFDTLPRPKNQSDNRK